MNIAWVGDSITVGTSPIVRDRLASLGAPIVITTLAKVGAPLPWMASQMVPEGTDVVILAGGTNDLVGAGAEGAFETLKNTRAALSTGGRRVVVATIPPCKERGPKTARYNELIRTLGAGNFLETGGMLTLEDLSGDGVHPSSAGYQKLAGLYADAILKLDAASEVPVWAWVLGGAAVGSAVVWTIHRRRSRRLR